MWEVCQSLINKSPVRFLRLAVVIGFLNYGLWAGNSLQAMPVEVGLNYAIGMRQSDRFSRGVENFRSSLSPSLFRNVEVDPFTSMNSFEYFIRAAALDEERHFVGLAVGNYYVPDFNLQEIRSDGVITNTKWSFSLPYLLFTYGYVGEMPWRFFRRRKIEWEGGAAFGFVFSPGWKVKGYSASRSQYLRYNINQRGRTGNLARLNLGLRKYLIDDLFFRMGLRATYLYVGAWSGQINSGDGAWHYLRDGSLVALSSFNLLAAESIVLDREQGLTQAALIDDRAGFSSGVLELQFSLGIRF